VAHQPAWPACDARSADGDLRASPATVVLLLRQNPAGRLITRVTSDVETLNELLQSGVVAGLGDLFTLIAISVAMLHHGWRLALASFAVIPSSSWCRACSERGTRTYRDIRSDWQGSTHSSRNGCRECESSSSSDRSSGGARFDELNRRTGHDEYRQRDGRQARLPGSRARTPDGLSVRIEVRAVQLVESSRLRCSVRRAGRFAFRQAVPGGMS